MVGYPDNHLGRDYVTGANAWLLVIQDAAKALDKSPPAYRDMRSTALDNYIRFAIAGGCSDAAIIRAGGTPDRIATQARRILDAQEQA